MTSIDTEGEVKHLLILSDDIRAKFRFLVSYIVVTKILTLSCVHFFVTRGNYAINGKIMIFGVNTVKLSAN